MQGIRKFRGSKTRVFVAAAAVALLTGPSAFAATPRQIERDLRDNGRLDGKYSAADLRAALRNPTLAGYGAPATRAQLRPAVAKVLRAQRQAQPSRQQPLGGAPQTGTLPFTGVDLGLMAAGGAGLLLLGGGLRRMARERQQ